MRLEVGGRIKMGTRFRVQGARCKDQGRDKEKGRGREETDENILKLFPGFGGVKLNV